MRKLLAAFAIALALAGCALMSGATKPLGSATMADLQKGAYAAKLSFQAALTAAVVYIELPRCGRIASPTLCSEQSVVDVMRKAIVAADNGTQAAEDAARAISSDSPALTSLIAASLPALVTAAERSVTALQTITPKK